MTLVVIVSMTLAACSRGRDPGTVDCTPGATLLVGCSSACGIGSCSGDPVLRVCDGVVDTRACADANAILRESDDSCSTLCPSTRVVCPASGSITVVHRAFRSGESVCDWAVTTVPAIAEDPEPLPIDAGGDDAAVVVP